MVQMDDQAVDHSFHINKKDPIIEFFRENEPDLLTKLLVTPVTLPQKSEQLVITQN